MNEDKKKSEIFLSIFKLLLLLQLFFLLFNLLETIKAEGGLYYRKKTQEVEETLAKEYHVHI